MKSKRRIQKLLTASIVTGTLVNNVLPVNALENATNDKEIQTNQRAGFAEDTTTGTLFLKGNTTELNHKLEEARSLGLVVQQTELVNLGIASTDEEVALKEVEIENQINLETTLVSETVENYKQEKQRVDNENARIDEENTRLTNEYNTAKQVYESEKARIEQENAEKERKYQEDLQRYNEIVAENEKIELENQNKLSAYNQEVDNANKENDSKFQEYSTNYNINKDNVILSTPNGKLLGEFGNIGADYYKNVKYFINPEYLYQGIEFLKSTVINPNSKVEYLDVDDPKYPRLTGVNLGSADVGYSYEILTAEQFEEFEKGNLDPNNFFKGKKFIVRNAFETESGKTIDLRITVDEVNIQLDANLAYFFTLKVLKDTGGLAVWTDNIKNLDLKYELLDQETGDPIKIGLPLFFGDVDLLQYVTVYGNGNTDIGSSPQATDITSLMINDKLYYGSKYNENLNNTQAVEHLPTGSVLMIVDPNNNGTFNIDYRQQDDWNTDYYYEMFARDSQIGIEKFIETPLPKRPTLKPTTDVSRPNPTAPEYTPSELPVEPIKPTLLSKLTDPTKPLVQYRNFEFEYTPQAQKFIIDLEGTDIHNKLIFKNSKFNYVLTPPKLEENREDILAIEFKDVIPEGLEVEFVENNDYTYSYDENTRTVTYTLKLEKLFEIRDKKGEEYRLSPIVIKAQAKNDSAIYLNNAEFIVKTITQDGVEHEYRDTTKTVITGTPGEKPTNPNRDNPPKRIEGDSLVNPTPIKSILNKSFNNDEEHFVEFNLNWNIKPYENIHLGNDSFGLSGLVDFYSSNLEFVELLAVKDVDGNTLDVNQFATITYKDGQIIKDESNIQNHANRKWEEYDFGNQYTVIVPLDENKQPTLPNYVSGKDLVFTVKMKLDNTKAPYKAENKVAQYDKGNGYLGNIVEVSPQGKVTYEFISGTPNEVLPQDIIDLTPSENDLLDYGTNVEVDKTFEIVKTYGDYEWRFESFDKESDILDGSQDHFIGTWVKYGKPIFEFISKDGSDLPQEVKDLTPIIDEYTKYTNETTPVDPQEKEVVLGNDKFTFVSYDKDKDVIDGDDKFIGAWLKASKPTYEYVSGTPNEELPQEVLIQLPTYKGDFVELGKEVLIEETFEKTVDTPNGRWVFKGYDKDKDIIDNENVFKGTWIKQGNPVYEFKSESGILPKEVLDLLPKDPNFYDYGAEATVIPPKELEVKVENGTWVFVSYDKDKDNIDGNDKFIGTWKFVPNVAIPNTNDSIFYTFVLGMLSLMGLGFLIRKRKENK